jgi:small subunit ribosomal protein S16
MKIRLARGGSKKRPFYSIVAADSRMPRDGRFLEKLGTYNPLLPKDSEDRVKMDVARVKELIALGAQPTDRIARMLEAAGEMPKSERSNPQKAVPGKAAQERAKSKAEKAAKPVEAPAEVKEEAHAEAPVEEAATEAPAEAAAEAPAEDAPAEEAAAEDAAKTEEKAE